MTLSVLVAAASAGVLAAPAYASYAHPYASPYAASYAAPYAAAYHAPAYHAPAVVAHSPYAYGSPVVKTVAPLAYSAPIVKHVAPYATSYANTYKVRVSSSFWNGKDSINFVFLIPLSLAGCPEGSHRPRRIPSRCCLPCPSCCRLPRPRCRGSLPLRRGSRSLRFPLRLVLPLNVGTMELAVEK